MTPEEIVKLIRTFEIDHAPNGYPAIEQRILSKAADILEAQRLEVDRLRDILSRK